MSNYVTKDELNVFADGLLARIQEMLAPEEARVEVAPAAKTRKARTRKAAAPATPATGADDNALHLSAVAPAWLKAMMPGETVKSVADDAGNARPITKAEFTNVAKALSGFGGGYIPEWNESLKAMVYTGRPFDPDAPQTGKYKRSGKAAGKKLIVSKKGGYVTRVS